MPWSFYDKNGNLKEQPAAAVVPAVEVNTPTTAITNAATLQLISAWTNETYKTVAGMHAAGVDGKLVATVAGRYLVSAYLEWNAVPTNSLAQFRKNGTTAVGGSGWNAQAGAGINGAGGSVILNLAAGDYIELMAAQNSATGSLGLTANSHFSMQYIDGAVQVPVAYPASLVGQLMASGSRTTDFTTTGTTFAGGGDFIVGSVTFTADGVSTYCIEGFSAEWYNSGANQIAANLVLDGVDQGIYELLVCPAANSALPFNPKAYITPAAGSHTVNWRIYSTTASTTTVRAGAGGAGNLAPGTIRVTKAS